MKLETVTDIGISTIMTDSGMKTPLGNASFDVGEEVWVEGNYVFGTQRNSAPMMPSGLIEKPGDYLVIKTLYGGRPYYRYRQYNEDYIDKSIVNDGNLFLYNKSGTKFTVMGSSIKELNVNNGGIKTWANIDYGQPYYDSDENLIVVALKSNTYVFTAINSSSSSDGETKILTYKNDELTDTDDFSGQVDNLGSELMNSCEQFDHSHAKANTELEVISEDYNITDYNSYEVLANGFSSTTFAANDTYEFELNPVYYVCMNWAPTDVEILAACPYIFGKANADGEDYVYTVDAFIDWTPEFTADDELEVSNEIRTDEDYRNDVSGSCSVSDILDVKTKAVEMYGSMQTSIWIRAKNGDGQFLFNSQVEDVTNRTIGSGPVTAFGRIVAERTVNGQTSTYQNSYSGGGGYAPENAANAKVSKKHTNFQNGVLFIYQKYTFKLKQYDPTTGTTLVATGKVSYHKTYDVKHSGEAFTFNQVVVKSDIGGGYTWNHAYKITGSDLQGSVSIPAVSTITKDDKSYDISSIINSYVPYPLVMIDISDEYSWLIVHTSDMYSINRKSGAILNLKGNNNYSFNAYEVPLLKNVYLSKLRDILNATV